PHIRPAISSESVEAITCHQLTPELAECVAHSARVIFIDSVFGEPSGKVNLRELKPTSSNSRVFSHQLDPSGLMQYARELYGIWPQALVVSVNGAAYGYTDMLSPPVRSSLPAVRQLMEDLAFNFVQETLLLANENECC